MNNYESQDGSANHDAEVQFELSSEKSQGGVPIINVNFVDRIKKIRAKTPKGAQKRDEAVHLPPMMSGAGSPSSWMAGGSSPQPHKPHREAPQPAIQPPAPSLGQGVPEMTIYIEDILKSEDYLKLKKSLES